MDEEELKKKLTALGISTLDGSQHSCQLKTNNKAASTLDQQELQELERRMDELESLDAL